PGLADPANLGNSPGRWQQRSMKESRCTGYALPPSTEWHRSRFHSSLSPLKCSLASPRATRWFEDALRGSRIVGELGQRPPWACDELTTAVWACAAENGRRASLAKRAFERADARFRGLGRKVLVAALAVWSQLKHGVLPEVGICGSGSPCMDEATTTERPILPGRFLEANHDVFAIEPLLRQGSHMARLASRLIPHRHRARAELHPTHKLQVDVLRKPREQRRPMACEPGVHHELVLVDQAQLRQRERELHACNEQPLTRLAFELPNSLLQIPAHELRVPIDPVQGARHDVLLLRVD